MSSPTPRHLRSSARLSRRAEPRHRRPPEVEFGSLTTLAATVVGAAVVASSTYGFVPSAVSAADSGGAAVTASWEAARHATRVATDWALLGAGEGATAAPIATVDESQFEPAFISMPAISTTSPLIQLGLTAERTLEVPVDFGVAGWYRLGPRPGDPGPAVIAGHLDSYTGPAIFARLNEMKAGDQILVTRRDGTTLEFSVTRVDQYPKSAFPTRQVYGPTDASELRVITCGGSFDRSAGSYHSNTVVYAKLVTPEAGASQPNGSGTKVSSRASADPRRPAA